MIFTTTSIQILWVSFTHRGFNKKSVIKLPSSVLPWYLVTPLSPRCPNSISLHLQSCPSWLRCWCFSHWPEKCTKVDHTHPDSFNRLHRAHMMQYCLGYCELEYRCRYFWGYAAATDGSTMHAVAAVYHQSSPPWYS